MLLEISIKNFVIIEDETIRFNNGLNIITGETGSGKSLVIDCINAICGGRFSKEHIRSGTTHACVQALFYIANNNIVKGIMAENGLFEEDEDNLVISREVNDSGRSSCRINGQIVTLSIVKKITQNLVDIIGQSEHQQLFNENKHVEFLDTYGDKEIAPIKSKLYEVVSKIKMINQNLDKVYGDKIKRERKIDLLKFQITEINDANIKEDEEVILKSRKAILINAEKLYKNINLIYNNLFQSSDAPSIVDKIGATLNFINDIVLIDESICKFKSVIENALYSLDDIKSDLRNYRDNIEFNDGEINEIEERLYLIDKLKRKYGSTIREILDYKTEIESEYNELINSEEIAKKLIKELALYNNQYKELAKELSKARQNISQKLKSEVEKNLNDLNMKGAKFEVSIISDEEVISSNGIDKIEFLLTSNPGEPPKALAKIASGGEISRVLLAIKCCLTNAQNIPCLVFDEVDAGIGGLTADIVGQKIKTISKENEVICITHLPQIASYGDSHIRIDKTIVNQKTYTKITNLSYEERIAEISRMLSGHENIEMSYLHAKALLNKKLPL